MITTMGNKAWRLPVVAICYFVGGNRPGWVTPVTEVTADVPVSALLTLNRQSDHQSTILISVM